MEYIARVLVLISCVLMIVSLISGRRHGKPRHSCALTGATFLLSIALLAWSALLIIIYEWIHQPVWGAILTAEVIVIIFFRWRRRKRKKIKEMLGNKARAIRKKMVDRIKSLPKPVRQLQPLPA